MIRIYKARRGTWFILDHEGTFHGWYETWEEAFMEAQKLKNPPIRSVDGHANP